MSSFFPNSQQKTAPKSPYNHPSFLTMTGNNDADKPEEERRFNAGRPNMERLTVADGRAILKREALLQLPKEGNQIMIELM